MRVAALLAKRIELIEEQNALMGTHEIEQALKSAARFSEKATYHCFVSNNEQRNH